MRVYRMVSKDGHGPFSSINSPIDYISHHKTPYAMIFGKCDTFRKSVLAKLGKPEWVFAWDTERRMFEFFTNAERIEEMGFVIWIGLCICILVMYFLVRSPIQFIRRKLFIYSSSII